jgi:hypothetical protein
MSIVVIPRRLSISTIDTSMVGHADVLLSADAMPVDSSPADESLALLPRCDRAEPPAGSLLFVVS